MWWWLSSVTSGAAILVLMRWMFHVARPADDWRRVSQSVSRWGAGLVTRLRETGRRLWRYYGPISQEMRDRWALLRFRFQSGAYGQEGT